MIFITTKSSFKDTQDALSSLGVDSSTRLFLHCFPCDNERWDILSNIKHPDFKLPEFNNSNLSHLL